MPLSLNNSLLFITMKLGQRIVQDPRIHCCVILNLWAMLPSRWAFRLAQLHGDIVMCLQNIAPSCTWPYRMHRTHQHYKKIWAHPLPNAHLLWQLGRGNHIWNQKNKNIKPNVKINNLDEGYPLQNEGIASVNKILKHMIHVLQRWI